MNVERFCTVSPIDWMLVTCCVLLISFPLALIQNFKQFFLANISCIVVIILFSSYAIFQFTAELMNYNAEKFAKKNLIPFSFNNFFEMYGVSISSLEVISVVMPIRNKIRKKTDFIKIYSSVSIFVIILGILVALSAYIVKNHPKNPIRHSEKKSKISYSSTTLSKEHC